MFVVKCLDTFEEHAAHCRELTGFKYRNDLVRDVLFDIFRRAGISVKKKALVNFLTDSHEGRSTLRPADVLVYGWVGGKGHAWCSGLSPKLIQRRARPNVPVRQGRPNKSRSIQLRSTKTFNMCCFLR
jgi:hypothetical protein